MEFEVSEITVGNKPIKGIKIIGEAAAQRNATHTIVLLDLSGSMNENSKLQNVKKSLSFLVRFLQSNDKLSLVTFNYQSVIEIQNTNVTSEYLQTFQHIIDNLNAEGGTNLSAGLLNVKSMLSACDNGSGMKTGLIILTDGHTNEGVTTPREILRIIESIKTVNPSISITTIGYNEDHNAEILKSIAETGGGSYNIVNNIEQVATVFGDILGGLMSTVVQNCYAKFDSSWKTLNTYPLDESGDKKILKIGDITAESETILLFENTNSTIVEIGGVSTKDYSTITRNVHFTNLTQNNQAYYIAFIRFELADILKNLRILRKQDITARLEPIKNYLNTATHPIVSYLRREIIAIENQIEHPEDLNVSQNLQASACLAFGRGTSAARGPIRRNVNFVDINENLANALNNMNMMASPFANTTQRLVSRHAVDYTQTSEDDPDDAMDSQS